MINVRKSSVGGRKNIQARINPVWWTLKTIKNFAVLRSTNSKKIFVFRSEIPFLGCTKVRKSKFSLYQGPQIHIFPLYEGPQIRKNRCINVRKSGVRER